MSQMALLNNPFTEARFDCFEGFLGSMRETKRDTNSLKLIPNNIGTCSVLSEGYDL